MTYGYIRVSTREQHLDRQEAAMREAGISPRYLYTDKQSGKDFERPAYHRLLRRMKPGDLLVIKSIDRLGRNYNEVIEQWRILTKERGVDIRVLDMPLLDTTHAKDLLGTFISDLTLQVLSYCAHAERDNTRQRQREGIATAKARGVRFGRPRKELPDNIDEIYASWRRGELTGKEVALQCDMGLGVLYRKLKERGIQVQDSPKPPPRRKPDPSERQYLPNG